MQTEMIDRIYEASFLPELWPDVLDELGQITDCEGGLLFSDRDHVLSWTSSDVLAPSFHAYLTDGWFEKCHRRVCMMTKAHAAFLTEKDYWTDEEIETNPIYRDFFRARWGLGWSAGTGLMLPTNDKIVFSIERKYDQGPVEPKHVASLNALRPHLARSAMIAARLGLKRAKGASEAMSLLGLPTFLFNAKGAVVESHNVDDTTSAHIVWGANNRLKLKDPNADKLLWSCLQQLNVDGGDTVQSFPLRSQAEHAAMVAHVIPVSRSVQDLFAQSYALLVLTPVTKKNLPPVELVRSLFDLTASEASVARELAGGETVEDIAANRGVALSTVRTQLRNIMAKTGCSRQAEIVALMSNVSLKR